MFDIDSGKLLIIGIVALVVIGPKELPGVMRQVGLALGKVRRMAAEFQGQFMDAMRESELEELKKDVDKLSQSADLKNFDPLADVKSQLEEVGAQVETSISAPVEPVASADLPAPEEAGPQAFSTAERDAPPPDPLLDALAAPLHPAQDSGKTSGAA